MKAQKELQFEAKAELVVWWVKHQWLLGGKGPKDPSLPLSRKEFIKALLS